ncbi:unnamed protein product [Medioppia subpectinata]|uniref:Fork-head domain-containing protein n=1 Tax=Medioppia subpectinata TaxID=1979941 RepID=A0A7R9KNB9_9ACAR|nr:unnamed protein product [Medioppia subpectinata]CAG2106697.1 unnamed protein product [Medioppia subpectinata]
MCESDSNGTAQAMIALRMKSSAVNPFLANPMPNENNPQITSTSVNNITAVNNAFSLANVVNHRIPSSQSSQHFNLSDYQRFQFYDYASQASVRFRLSQSPFGTPNTPYNLSPGYGHPAFADGPPFAAAISPFARFDSRFRFIHEEPKPQHSYIGLIAMAILSANEQKMVLSDIYQHILDNYPYFRNRGPGWRNSIRHNLSLNDCFVKAGRSANGKGHYWAIHPANIDDFKKGDFRRRKAQRKVRKHMGLSVPEDEDSPSPTPPPLPNGTAQAMIALRMKSSAVNPFLANPMPNENNPQITSTSVNNITAVNNAFSLANVVNHRIPSSQSSQHFNLSDYQRFQFYDYASQASVRFRLSQSPFGTPNTPYNLSPGYGHPAFADGPPFAAAISPFARFDSRFRFIHEEPKPQHSYIGLIAMAILSANEQKMVLSDIYQHILDNYPYFRNRGPGWRNSIRHNLSLNDCFVKAGRSANGKGHYWAIHPANIDDFKKGDFRRRKAQRKVRKHMGLSVPEDEDSPSPTPPPLPSPNLVNASVFGHSALMGPSGLRIHANQAICANEMSLFNDLRFSMPTNKLSANQDMRSVFNCRTQEDILVPSVSHTNIKAIKRQFDVESLLAPDCDSTVDDSLSRSEIMDKKSHSIVCIDHLEEGRRSNTPSLTSHSDFITNKMDSFDSNSSSPSISSTAERQHSPPVNSKQCLPATGLPLSPTSWRAAHIQSLQNLHQMNAINQSLQSVAPTGFAANLPWAMSAAALSNAQMAATILGYASFIQFDVESLLAPDCDSTVDDSLSRSEIMDKKSHSIVCIDHLEEGRRSNTPSLTSHSDFITNKMDSFDSNSSSPSISSTAERQHSPPVNSKQCLPATGLPLSPTSWRAAHIQSLQNLHQMNAINQSLQSVAPTGFAANLPWAMSAAALSNAQMAATILGYASVANQAYDLTSDANKR